MSHVLIKNDVLSARESKSKNLFVCHAHSFVRSLPPTHNFLKETADFNKSELNIQGEVHTDGAQI